MNARWNTLAVVLVVALLAPLSVRAQSEEPAPRPPPIVEPEVPPTQAAPPPTSNAPSASGLYQANAQAKGPTVARPLRFLLELVGGGVGGAVGAVAGYGVGCLLGAPAAACQSFGNVTGVVGLASGILAGVLTTGYFLDGNGQPVAVGGAELLGFAAGGVIAAVLFSHGADSTSAALAYSALFGLPVLLSAFAYEGTSDAQRPPARVEPKLAVLPAVGPDLTGAVLFATF